MTKASKKDAMYARIESHGRKLLAIYPDAMETDPVKLCKRLRVLEGKGHRFGLQLCNGPEFSSEEESDNVSFRILNAVRCLLGDGPEVFLNRDPRGYALKIRSESAKGLDIAKDWGGYGLIAPDLSDEG
jgi:hypothetical protein